MRISVVGTSGSGKSTLAEFIAAQLGMPFVELDAINWQPGWRDLNTYDPDEFARRVAEATAPDAWVIAGNYSKVRPVFWPRVTHVVWLDYERSVVMRRVIWRSLRRAVDRKELWPGTGNREGFKDWLNPEHPIRWAWSTFERHRQQYRELLGGSETRKVVRLCRPHEAGKIIEKLRDA